MKKIAFIGLGTMGTPMAKRLLKFGCKVNIFDISKEAQSKFTEENVIVSKSPEDACSEVDFCITMLPRSEDVYEAILGPNGAINSLKRKSLVIEMSTIYPETTKDIYNKLSSEGTCRENTKRSY